MRACIPYPECVFQRNTKSSLPTYCSIKFATLSPLYTSFFFFPKIKRPTCFLHIAEEDKSICVHEKKKQKEEKAPTPRIYVTHRSFRICDCKWREDPESNRAFIAHDNELTVLQLTPSFCATKQRPYLPFLPRPLSTLSIHRPKSGNPDRQANPSYSKPIAKPDPQSYTLPPV